MAETAPKNANSQCGYLGLKMLSLLYSRYVLFIGAAVLVKAGLGCLHQSMGCSRGIPEHRAKRLVLLSGSMLTDPLFFMGVEGGEHEKAGKAQR